MLDCGCACDQLGFGNPCAGVNGAGAFVNTGDGDGVGEAAVRSRPAPPVALCLLDLDGVEEMDMFSMYCNPPTDALCMVLSVLYDC